jgi:hypothetical protein
MNGVQRQKVVSGESFSLHEKNPVEAFLFIEDRGGRRSGLRKREFSYDAHIPERRSGTERRSGDDRRETVTFQMHSKGRRVVEGMLAL